MKDKSEIFLIFVLTAMCACIAIAGIIRLILFGGL